MVRRRNQDESALLPKFRTFVVAGHFLGATRPPRLDKPIRICQTYVIGQVPEGRSLPRSGSRPGRLIRLSQVTGATDPLRVEAPRDVTPALLKEGAI